MNKNTIKEIYRFRSIESLLGRGELKNSTIYFASPAELNDPLEGHINLFFSGDRIVWKNLFKNFITSFLKNYRKSTLDCYNTLTDRNIETAPTDYAKPIQDAVETVTSHPIINAIITEFVHSGISSDELKAYLHLLQAPAIAAYTDAINHSYLKYVKTLPKTLDELQASLAMGIEGVLSNRNMQQEIWLDLAKSDLTTEARNEFFIKHEFIDLYLIKLSKLVYRDWYAACFMENFENSAIWGTYGTNHRGVCLIHAVSNDQLTPPLQGPFRMQEGYYEGGFSQPLMKVNYEASHHQVNFFESIVVGDRAKIRKHWYSDQNGNVSDVADASEWNEKHQQNFYLSRLVKLNHWANENEYRLILPDMVSRSSTAALRTFNYKFHNLIGIVFGIKTTIDHKLKIIEIIREKCVQSDRHDFKFYQAYFCESSKTIKSREMKDLNQKINVR